jgi:hypothetical protein
MHKYGYEYDIGMIFVVMEKLTIYPEMEVGSFLEIVNKWRESKVGRWGVYYHNFYDVMNHGTGKITEMVESRLGYLTQRLKVVPVMTTEEIEESGGACFDEVFK